MNTKLNYLYRDASNYKTWNEEVLEGGMDDGMFQRLIACCDGENSFVPDNVGLDLDRGWDYDPQEDHPWCELISYELCDGYAASGITVQELQEAFEEHKDHWDDTAPALAMGL